MIWTKETPTVPGWYWNRDGINDPSIDRLVDYEGVLKLVVGGCYMSVYQLFDTEWCGPIQPPPYDKMVIHIDPAKADEIRELLRNSQDQGIIAILNDDDFPSVRANDNVMHINAQKIAGDVRLLDGEVE